MEVQVQYKSVSLSKLEHTRLLAHEAAKELKAHQMPRVSLGWKIISDTNHFDSGVLLVNMHQPLMLLFKHDKPYHCQMRAYIQATIYANDKPANA